MPKFTTISPTCEYGGKRHGWERFLHGGYIALGWCYDTDLTGKSIEEILLMIPGTSGDQSDERDGLYSFPIFWELCQRGARGCGDYVAVKNVSHGLFGVGIIRSGYKYSRYKHDTGIKNHYYPHYLDVEWIRKKYIPRTKLVLGKETCWRPYGTFGQLYPMPPSYIKPYIRAGSDD